MTDYFSYLLHVLKKNHIDFITIFQLFPSINSYHLEVFITAHK